MESSNYQPQNILASPAGVLGNTEAYGQKMKELHRLLTNIASSEGERDLLIKTAYENREGINYDFLHAVFFPEYTEPARWPVSFGMPTAVFTQKFSFTLYTGTSGNG